MPDLSLPKTDLISNLDKLRATIELIEPDLREYMKASFPAIVTKVHDDDADPDTYYRVDIKIERAGKNGSDLALPKVPVDAVFAENGYGLFALPEEGSIVTVEFDNFDKTRPHITGSRYLDGMAPEGFKAGTFAIRGKHGQKIELKPDSSEVVITGESLKVIRGTGNERTGKDFSHQVDNNHTLIVKNTSVHQAKKYRDEVLQDVVRQYGSLDQSINGIYSSNVGGSFTQVVTGKYSNTVAGDYAQSSMGNYRRIVAGNTEILAAGGSTGNYAYSVQAPAKGILLNVLPTFGFIELGQGAYPNSPAVCLTPLMAVFKTLLKILKTTPLQIGNMGAPTAPNPALAAVLTSLEQAFFQSALTSPLGSKAVFIREI